MSGLSDNENIEEPVKKKTKAIEYSSSSSESDIESYLQKPEDLNLNSTFFKSASQEVKCEVKKYQKKTTLSESDSDDPLDYYVRKKDDPQPSTSNNVDVKEEYTSFHGSDKTFESQNKQAVELEEARKQVEAYLARRKTEIGKDAGVNDLLAIGEKPFDLAKDLAEVGFHPSDFESGSENDPEDWEEVEHKEKQEKNVIPKDGIQITLDVPNAIKKKKGLDLMAALKRRMNRIRKENQVYVHKVHLLCWIAHGNYVNAILNQDSIMAVALSMIPSKECYPPARSNLKYLEQITNWYHKAVKCNKSDNLQYSNLETQIESDIENKAASNVSIYVYIFVAMLRALGLQCRLILSLQVEPLRPPASDLCSLKSEKNTGKVKSKLQEIANDKKETKLNKKADTTKVKNPIKRSKSAPKAVEVQNKDELVVKAAKPTKSRSKSAINLQQKTEAIEKGTSTSKITRVDVKPSIVKKKAQSQVSKPAINTSLEEKSTNLDDEHTKSSSKRSKSASDISKSGENNSTSTSKVISTRRGTKTKSPLLMKASQVEVDEKSLVKRSKSSETQQKLSTKHKIPATGSDVEAKKKKPNLGKLKSTSSIEDDDFKEPLTNGTETIPKLKVTKSDVKKGIKRPKSASKESEKSVNKAASAKRKSKIESNIDATLAVLESLEQPKSSKTTPLLNASISSSDEDIFDRAVWRRAKSLSPMVAPVEKSTERQTRSRTKKSPVFVPNPAILEPAFQSTDDEMQPKKKNIIKVKLPRIPKKIPKETLQVPQVDGQFDSDMEGNESPKEDLNIREFESNDKFEIDDVVFNQCDGADDVMETRKKSPRLKKILKKGDVDSKSSTCKKPPNLKKLTSPPSGSKSNEDSSDSKNKTVEESRFFSSQTLNIKDDVVKLVKETIRNAKQKLPGKSKKNQAYDSDSDFMPEELSPERKRTPVGKVKKRVLPRKQLEALAKEKAEMDKLKPKGIDIWVEVFLEEEEKWISADVVHGKVHCVKDIYNKATHPVSYILSWDNTNRIKDVTKRYCFNWNTATRKLRTDPLWWQEALKGFVGKSTARDKEEDDDLARQQLDQPLPKTITEYKDHPLYVLKRHLLKFQAIYPPDAAVLGFIRGEEVYSRDCVYILHSREIWLKHAKVVKPGEQPYKIVKARPKYDKLSNTMITDQLLEIFGVWQVQDYDPPTAENGVVPRNAYGNVELFKPCMLPKKCVHLQLPGLNKIAHKLNIDCAPAVVGFDFHSGFNHAVYDGYIVCEEFKDTLITAWEKEQEAIAKREQEKYEKRVYGNWRRLIKAALIRERLKLRYDFAGERKAQTFEDEPEEEAPIEPVKPPEEEKPVKKRPKFMSRK